MASKILFDSYKSITRDDEILKTSFDIFDKDKSGFIDRVELKDAAIHIRTLSTKKYNPKNTDPKHIEEEITNILNEFDYNKDGKISYGEYKDFMKKVALKIMVRILILILLMILKILWMIQKLINFLLLKLNLKSKRQKKKCKMK